MDRFYFNDYIEELNRINVIEDIEQKKTLMEALFSKQDRFYKLYKQLKEKKDTNKFDYFENIFYVLIHDIIKRLKDDNFCSVLNNKKEICNRNIYCKYKDSDNQCETIGPNEYKHYKDLFKIDTFNRMNKEFGANENVYKENTTTLRSSQLIDPSINLKKITQYKLLITEEGKNELIMIKKEENEKAILFNLLDNLTKIISNKNYNYVECLIIVLNYLLLITHIFYKNYNNKLWKEDEYRQTFKLYETYQNINNTTKKILVWLNFIINQDDSIIIPLFKNIGYSYFLKMGEIPLYIFGINISDFKYVHNTNMLPIIYSWHDIVHSYHFINKKKRPDYNFIEGNNNKILLWYYINLYKSNERLHPFNNNKRVMEKEERNIRTTHSRRMIILLFYIIHEGHNDVYSNLDNIIKTLSKKHYHLDYYNIFHIIETLWFEYIADCKIEENTNETIKNKFSFERQEDLESFKKKFTDEFIQSLLLLVYILKKIFDKKYMELHNELQSYHINKIIENVNKIESDKYLLKKEQTYMFLLKDEEQLFYYKIEKKIINPNIQEILNIKVSYESYRISRRIDINLIDLLNKCVNLVIGRPNKLFTRCNIPQLQKILIDIINKMEDYYILDLFKTEYKTNLQEGIKNYLSNPYIGMNKKIILLFDIFYCKKMRVRPIIEIIDMLIENIYLFYNNFYINEESISIKRTTNIGFIGIINHLNNEIK
jgi:hypothetical protein